MDYLEKIKKLKEKITDLEIENLNIKLAQCPTCLERDKAEKELEDLKTQSFKSIGV